MASAAEKMELCIIYGRHVSVLSDSALEYEFDLKLI